MNKTSLIPSGPLLLILLAFAFNINGLAADSFWGDEILTASFASRSFPEIIAWTANDIHPPLYYLIANIFTGFTISLGSTATPSITTDWLWRFVSVVAVVLTVAITYRLAQSLFRRVSKQNQSNHDLQISATTPLVLLVVAPLVLKYGQEARMHALFMCFSALSTWLLFRAITKPAVWHRWLFYTLSITATIYTMYFGFLILATHGGFVLALLIYQATSGRNSFIGTLQTSLFIGFSSASLLTFLLYGPWWPILFSILQKRASVGAIEGGVGDPIIFISGVVDALGPQPQAVAWTFFALYLIGLLLLVRRHWPIAILGLSWLGLPILLPVFLGDPRALQFRYAFVLPVYLTIISFTIITMADFVQAKWPTLSPSQITNPGLATYLIWILATFSFLATLNIYQEPKPDWRGVATYLSEHTQPADVIIYGPLWDEGRFVEYYYQGQAQLLTPAAMVANIQGRVESLRANGGRIWAVNRFTPAEIPAMKNIEFSGVVVTEPEVPVYEVGVLTQATIGLAAQAVEAAYPWAAEAQAQGVLDPDPRTAQAVALKALGDSYIAINQPQEALGPYQQAVEIFPGWVNGYLSLAETQEALGDFPGAAKSYQQAVAFNLEWQGPAANEASQLITTEQWDAAISQYRQIIGRQ